ncbi:MAG TPA: di-heme oxidoredictase family protein, partial [Planctomycetaceae bacterium]|nr:di-heme oxidoredictase family protein [Planctomycetaceae bacterium]
MNTQCRRLLLGSTLCLIAAGYSARDAAAGDEAGAKKGKASSDAAGISGRELFLREWIANDPRSHGGDGLGPVFNDTSCVSCHNQGGVGGG